MTPRLVRAVPCEMPLRIRAPRRAHVVREVVLNLAVVSAAIFACSLLRLPSRRHCCSFFGCDESLADITHLTVEKFALEAYPEWQVANPDRTCPGSLDELTRYMDRSDTKDPYGSSYVMTCTSKGIVVISPGEDAKLGTADDVRSDDR